MDSPSAQLIEPSIMAFEHPPSSPFVHEPEVQSFSPSKYSPSSTHETPKEPAESSPYIKAHDLSWNMEDEKENITVQESTLAKFFSPSKHSITSDNVVSDKTETLKNIDMDLMPPPSIVKTATTPTRAPLGLSRNGAYTPKSVRCEGIGGKLPPALAMSSASRGRTPTPVEDNATLDDTCFSTFSEIPDMTVFAKLRQSPSKQSETFHTPRADMGPTPRTSRKRSSPSRSPSPTPRSRRVKADTMAAHRDETTSLLIDFTQQMEGLSSYRPTSAAKSATESNLLHFINSQRSPNKAPRQSFATPSKQSNLMNLLDFELPPAPTPRSVPTITVRELESLKSSYLSQISNLKATLSGREAEVESLKKAVADAEGRSGEAQEALREERCRREHVEEEKESWERRGQEVEQVLRSVKEEVIKGEAEKEEMISRLDDAEKRVEEAETRAVKAEERFADALAARANDASGDVDAAETEERVQRLVSAQIDAKIEAVSRELHSVYKEKHERKVATLKKSYEARAEKKTTDLQSRISELEKENQELHNSKESTFTGPFNDASILTGDNAELKAQLEEQKASLARLQTEMEAAKSHQSQLENELRQERIEKGDLVAAVDEMLALQSEQPPTPGPNAMKGAIDMVQDFRKSISRPAGLKVPGSGIATPGESRIGKGSSLAASVGRSANSAAGKSRMLANIERMGRTGSKDGINGP